ncbi:alpha/beta fold hydrolase [Lysobacter pythonis]|uniref:Alpha/beta fold hydrolase n=1 Tax=Solilutibacter pythonis TaxID=2483112 RepID=A0A3M2HTF7_9GAMM|nr:alpha/beta fold hydrolase [Lysobacter pythonis]RMH91103.1 alpha/beta fold hydrolase [Lysobacter pythonis]
MRRALLALLFASTAMSAPAQVAPDTARATTTRLLDHLDRGEFAAAEAMFDDAMRQAVPQAMLAQIWKALPKASARGDVRLKTDGATRITLTPLKRGEAHFDATISIAADGRVSGLLVRPAQPATPAPPVPADATYTERETKVGSGERALPATLAMPQGAGPFPAVVLVHGSGPQDRDETIGPNKPFLDIARGLAAQGIAVLRYDKRTLARPRDYADGRIDIDGETTDDALAAVATLRATPGIDPGRVFVLGHSQGGMMAPRIGIREPRIAGLILLAAPARNLLDILLEQNDRLLKMRGARESEAGIAHMRRLESQIAAIRAGGAAEETGTPLDQPAGYWRSVEKVDPVAEARKARQPMLLLHGGRDIQVVEADWRRWQAAFGKDGRATLKHYPTLNHLGMESTENAGLERYRQPGHVDRRLIDDVAQWIKARR